MTPQLTVLDGEKPQAAPTPAVGTPETPPPGGTNNLTERLAKLEEAVEPVMPRFSSAK